MMGPDAPKLATPDAGLAEREAWAPAALTVEEAEAARAAAASQGAEELVAWWTRFGDPVLDRLITRADRTNADLGQALSRVRVAQAQLGVAEADLWPDIAGGANYDRIKQNFSQLAAQGVDVEPYSVWAYGLAMGSWEIDLWGRIRRLNEAELARYLATDEARRGVIVSLVGDISQAYFELLELDLEKEISIRSRDSFGKSFDLFQSRLEGGIASKLETSRAQAAAAQAAATIPEIERLISQKENQISILTGRNPGPIQPRGSLSDGSDLDRAIPAGLPTAMIRRRPDIRQSEQLLRAANAEIGVAIAEYYPKIGLTAVAGRVSPDLSDLTDGKGNAWSVGANITGPIFQGGRLQAQEAQARAAWDEARIRHEKAVLVALGEVSNSLIARQKFAASRVEQERAVAALNEAVGISSERYAAGRASYFEILDSQLELFPTELNLARVRLNQYLAVVTLYRALGGGWSPGSVSSAKEGL